MWTEEKPRMPGTEDDHKEQLQLHSGKVCSVHIIQNCSMFVHKLRGYRNRYNLIEFGQKKTQERQELKMIASDSHSYVVGKSAQCTLTKIAPFLLIN